MNDQPWIPVSITNIVGGSNMRPSVILQIGETKTFLSPDKAREIAAMLFESAEACQGDAWIAKFFYNVLGLPEAHAVSMLREFRTFRDAERGIQQMEDSGG